MSLSITAVSDLSVACSVLVVQTQRVAFPPSVEVCQKSLSATLRYIAASVYSWCRFRAWVDECSQLFGGLELVAVQAVVGKDGREYILEVCVCLLLLR